ncbi:ElaB/YqjD/DUF883 family membrane-anchored ribosome-binding protein [Lewinella aquimaris]|uniref:ElaB/YqjD/DUF883 family membrane-anchored ribosome-binding protein n=1 Tax=Neolewinella aquimaris TaxID=1835722 RepID=A0A840DX48_9BACT|nr:hypothetical protein [Neolewinella aquimaris]MBB4077510.1 ElaB/YqjD/DUF883 family membrane-anchored ribosome-binding protein [Neolewinella aquimaris]
MPIFNDLKRIFFGAKSVAKHQASRANEAAREAGDELAAQGDELIDLTKQAAREIAARAPGYIDKGKDALSELGDAVFKQADFRPKADRDTREGLDIIDEELTLGDLDETPPREAPKSGTISFEDDEPTVDPTAPPKEPSALRQVTDSTLDSAARAGLKAKDTAGKLADEALNRAAAAGTTLKGKADAFVEHANREAEKMKLEESIEQANAAAAQAEARARAFDNQEADRDTDKSTLSGTDSFFDRADRFARGDYHNEGGKPMRIQDDPDYRPRKKSDLIAGFDDADGDGDSLIDDAVIEEE